MGVKTKKPEACSNIMVSGLFRGGADQDRTGDLSNAIQEPFTIMPTMLHGHGMDKNAKDASVSATLAERPEILAAEDPGRTLRNPSRIAFPPLPAYNPPIGCLQEAPCTKTTS